MLSEAPSTLSKLPSPPRIPSCPRSGPLSPTAALPAAQAPQACPQAPLRPSPSGPSPLPRAHPATRTMTRNGSAATVKRTRASAGPKAIPAQPKKTAAPMVAGRGGAGHGTPGAVVLGGRGQRPLPAGGRAAGVAGGVGPAPGILPEAEGGNGGALCTPQSLPSQRVDEVCAIPRRPPGTWGQTLGWGTRWARGAIAPGGCQSPKLFISFSSAKRGCGGGGSQRDAGGFRHRRTSSGLGVLTASGCGSWCRPCRGSEAQLGVCQPSLWATMPSEPPPHPQFPPSGTGGAATVLCHLLSLSRGTEGRCLPASPDAPAQPRGHPGGRTASPHPPVTLVASGC